MNNNSYFTTLDARFRELEKLYADAIDRCIDLRGKYEQLESDHRRLRDRYQRLASARATMDAAITATAADKEPKA